LSVAVVDDEKACLNRSFQTPHARPGNLQEQAKMG
jgi:hypothetical protein